MESVSLFLFILLLALQLADAYLTWRLLRAGGRELNPLVRFLIDRIGLVPGLVLAKATVTVLTWLFLFDQIVLLLLATILYWFVVDHNVTQLYGRSKA